MCAFKRFVLIFRGLTCHGPFALRRVSDAVSIFDFNIFCDTVYIRFRLRSKCCTRFRYASVENESRRGDQFML